MYNKKTNRLQLSDEEVVGKDFLRCKDDEEDDENDNGKIIYINIYIYLVYTHSVILVIQAI